MHWKTKAFAQNLIARLPSRLSHACYYGLQRAMGSFREAQGELFLGVALALKERIQKHGGQIDGAVFMEVGTGRRVTLPVVLWLMGAEQIVTVDLHRYVRQPIVALDLLSIVSETSDAARKLRKTAKLRPDRLQRLQSLLKGEWDLPSLFDLCGIKYLAPADAGRLELPASSVDFHISYTVFEHIPANILQQILQEAGRILRPSGLAIHLVDHSDHFAHSDQSISAINFLQYEDSVWARLADNPYMYMNRLRVDDYPPLYQCSGHEISSMESSQDSLLFAQLNNPAFRLASRFRGKSPAVLATMSTWIVSRTHRPGPA